eukprot:s243_g31.t1
MNLAHVQPPMNQISRPSTNVAHGAMTSNRLGPGTTLSSMSSEGPGSDSSDESSSAGEGLETEEQAEGRRQAKLLRRMLVELEGSVLRAWRKFFETENDGGRINEFQFVRMCRQIRFPADPVQVFRYLDDDGSGELTLEELDQEGNDLWANFVEWCAQIFSGATDFIQKLLPKNGDKKLTAAQFEEGIVKSGWSRGSESLLFSAVNLRGDDAIDAYHVMRWLYRRMVRAEAWILRKLVFLFNRAAKRGHRPREAGIRELFKIAGIDVPDLSPRGPRPKGEPAGEPEPDEPGDEGDAEDWEDEEWEEEEAENDPTIEPHPEPMDVAAKDRDDDTNDDDWQSRLPPGVHDIVKCRVNGGECRKCGKVGTWDFIKSTPCQPRVPTNAAIPKSEPSPPPVPGHGEDLGKMLDDALKNGDEEAAYEIVAKMETQQAEESLQDQQLMLELMEQELELMDAMEQLEQLESLQKLEEEEAELEQAILLSKQPLEKVDPKFAARPPATPCTSSTAPPVVGKPVVAQPPSVCPDNLETLPMPTLEDSDAGGSDRPAALDNIRPIKPENQKASGKGKGKGRGRGRGRGRGKGSRNCEDESDGPKPKRRRTRKKKDDVEEDQEEWKEDEVPQGKKKSKAKGKKVESTKGDKGKKAKKEKGQASHGKEKPEETVGKKSKPKVSPCESQDPKGEATLAPKSKARKRKPTQDDKELDKPDKSSKEDSTTKKDEGDEKPSSSKDKPSRSRKPRASKGPTSSKCKDSEAPKTKNKRGKGDAKNSDAKAATKAKLSRKSAAYHRAKVAALKEGKDEKTAKDLGREVANASTVFQSWHLGSAGAAAPTLCLWLVMGMPPGGLVALGARKERVEALRRKLSNVARPEGEELLKLFRAHGNFETLEVQVRKKFTKAVEKAKSGGWFTKQYLESKEHWSMVAKAVQWAKASNKHRVSPVHGEEEIYLILSETFQAKEIEQEEMNREGNMEDEEGSLFQTDIPDLNAGDDAVLASTLPSSSSSANPGTAPAAVVGSTSAVMSFKLAAQMEAIVQKMQTKYDELTAQLSEATVKPDEIDRQPGLRYKVTPATATAVRMKWCLDGLKALRKGHTYTTRLLYTVLPSENYAPRSRTHDGLLQVLVDDLITLQRDGIEAKWS